MKRYINVIIILVALVFIISLGKNIYKQNLQKNDVQSIKSVACVGDSLTFRRSYLDEDVITNYPDVLAELLGNQYKVVNYGYAGTCVQMDLAAPYMNTRVYRNSIEADADILVLMLGTNDIWNEGWRNKETFYQHYVNLLDSYLQSAKRTKIYLCTIPKIYVDDDTLLGYDIQKKAEMISDVIREVAKEYGCYLIEMDKITVGHPEWYDEDGLHFNKDGAREVAEAIYKAIITI